MNNGKKLQIILSVITIEEMFNHESKTHKLEYLDLYLNRKTGKVTVVKTLRKVVDRKLSEELVFKAYCVENDDVKSIVTGGNGLYKAVLVESTKILSYVSLDGLVKITELLLLDDGVTLKRALDLEARDIDLLTE